MRALVVVMLASGIRLGEALAITMENVDLQADPVALHIPARIAKNKLPRTTYLTSEAAGVLREWLGYRAEYLEKKRGRPEYRTPLDDPRVFPFNDSAATDMFILACQKAGLHHTDRNTGKSTIRLHSCRKWFRSNLVKAGGNALDVTEKLMGHAGYLATSYVRLTEAEIQTFYRENEHHLFIFPGTSEKDRGNLKTLAEENAALRERMAVLEKVGASVEEKLSMARGSPEYRDLLERIKRDLAAGK
jgi:integrase